MNKLSKKEIDLINKMIDCYWLENNNSHIDNEQDWKLTLELVKKLTIPVVSQQRELLIALKDCRKWMINKGINVESEFFKKIDEAINCG